MASPKFFSDPHIFRTRPSVFSGSFEEIGIVVDIIGGDSLEDGKDDGQKDIFV